MQIITPSSLTVINITPVLFLILISLFQFHIGSMSTQTIITGNMRALDGLQGPVYVGTGCMFRRYALYGFNPPRAHEYLGVFGQSKRLASNPNRSRSPSDQEDDAESQPLTADHPDLTLPKKFGNSTLFTESIAIAEYQGRPLADHVSVKNGRPPGALLLPRPPLDALTVAEAVAVISCW